MSNKKMFKNLVIFKIDDIKEADLKKIERMSALKDMPSSVTSNKGFTNYLDEGDNFFEKSFLEALRENCSRRWLHNFIKVLFCLSMKISKFLADRNECRLSFLGLKFQNRTDFTKV